METYQSNHDFDAYEPNSFRWAETENVTKTTCWGREEGNLKAASASSAGCRTCLVPYLATPMATKRLAR